jgi:hypothetical protein
MPDRDTSSAVRERGFQPRGRGVRSGGAIERAIHTLRKAAAFSGWLRTVQVGADRRQPEGVIWCARRNDRVK